MSRGTLPLISKAASALTYKYRESLPSVAMKISLSKGLLMKTASDETQTVHY